MRVVPLPDGFAFFLHHRSSIGLALAIDPAVSLAFDWSEQSRVVVVEGRCDRVSAVEADAYYGRLPKREQLAVWAGGMEREGVARDEIAHSVAQFADRFAGQLIPRPTYWGGYRVIVSEMCFRQASGDGVLDILRYRNAGYDKTWDVRRESA
ncbi:hypothetical protein GCM10009799_48470 [Nocardiopsis rhodophaea]|uniref:Pyridoxamine 5'-phosphate oxidase n=1 Tax=Nocardiopsis rhodophaea TaxID=280238 RepID=A0ABP5F4J9_9ACTN